VGACTNNALHRCRLWRGTSIASSQLLQHSRTDQRGPSAGLRGRQAGVRAIGRRGAPRSKAPRLNITQYSLFTQVPSGKMSRGVESAGGEDEGHRFRI
jgi:hypothetical protein